MHYSFRLCAKFSPGRCVALVIESGGLVWRTPKTHEFRSAPLPGGAGRRLATLEVGKGRDDLVVHRQHMAVSGVKITDAVGYNYISHSPLLFPSHLWLAYSWSPVAVITMRLTLS